MANSTVSLTSDFAVRPAQTRSYRSLIFLGFVIALLAAFPFIARDYLIFQATLIIASAIAVLGLNLLTGYNGQISLGHGAFFAIGSYAAAISMERLNLPYYLAIPLAGVCCLIFGVLFGLPSLRLEGLYLAIATLALGVALPQLLKYKRIADYTGGVQGISVAKPSAPIAGITDDQWLYLFSLGVAVLMFFVARNIVKSHAGRAIMAIRDQPTAAAAMGINLARYKTITFGISAMYTGVAGALTAIAVQFIAPDSFGMHVSINFLVGMVVGGLGQLAGAVFGALFIHILPLITEELSKSATLAIYGFIMIVCVNWMPYGISGFLGQTAMRIRARLQGQANG